MATFDLVVAVDWSASSVPTTGADSIWIATSDGLLENPPTRAAAATLLDAIVDGAAGRRVLIGVDVPFGYPAGTAALFGLDGSGAPAWRAMWSFLAASVADDERNRNDRFAVAAALNRRGGLPAGPFWGRPARLDLDGLAPTKPRFAADVGGVAEWRACERDLRARGLRPFSAWQLAYAGSVGGQALTAIPVLDRLLGRCPRVEVWPCTTGFTDPATLAADAVVLAELWPSAFAFDRSRHRVKDAAQVLHVVDEVRAADAAARLAPWFERRDVSPQDREVALAEETWILVPPGSQYRG